MQTYAEETSSNIKTKSYKKFENQTLDIILKRRVKYYCEIVSTWHAEGQSRNYDGKLFKIQVSMKTGDNISIF